MELPYCPECKKQIQKRNSVIVYIPSGMYRKQKKIRLDKCLRNDIYVLNSDGHKTLACCCGHGVYPMTIICRHKNGRIYELMSNKTIPRKRNFYKMDSKGYYYIPEVSKLKGGINE